MPCYNSAKYLPEAIESILQQTFSDFEVIAVNDGSKDETKEILERYSSSDSRVHIFNLPHNVGDTKALKHGLLMSRREYLARMDADDVCLPTRFELQVRYLDEHPNIWILGTRFWSMDENLKKVNWDNTVPIDPDDVKRTLLEHCCIGHSTVMMRRKLIQMIGGYNEDDRFKVIEDYELWLRASRKFGIVNLPDYLLLKREYQGQVTDKLSETRTRNLKYIKELYS
jgi:glycosyltransferase involved in cell wall biosynthesis